VLTVLFSVLLLVQPRPAPAQVQPAGEGVALFNGKDLAGWHVQCRPGDREKHFWRVEEGTILCDSIGRKDHDYVWLMTDQEFADFELRLEFQAYRDSPGNSGVQFRSRFDASVDGGWLDGPQVDIHPPADMSWRTGFIYDETREEKRWVVPGLKDWTMDPGFEPARHVFRYADERSGWNELVLVCDKTRVKTVVNGIVVTDWDGRGVLDNAAHLRHRVGRVGHFALQLHTGDELRIRFRNVVVRELGRRLSGSPSALGPNRGSASGASYSTAARAATSSASSGW
jgi:hypothetical protein